MTEYHILSLGAGVQSTAVYLLAMDGLLPVRFDAAIFADTGDEPDDEQESVYRHLQWLGSLGGPPILIRTQGRLSDDISRALTTGGRFASIPAFILRPGETRPSGIGRRQCSKNYKVQVVERTIRRDVLGLAPRRRIPKSVRVHQYFGISLDEASRALRIRARFAEGIRRGVPHFPLLEPPPPRPWTRRDCERFLAVRVPHRVPRSACEQCPYHTAREWRHMKEHRPKGFALAVAVDEALRAPGIMAGRRMRGELYLHRSGRPLAEVDFSVDDRQGEFPGFALECEGVCGN